MNLRSSTEMERLIAEAREARGVIVGISRNVLQHGIPETGDNGYDRRINMRTLSPKIAFSGIRPMGRNEVAFFSSL